MIALNELTELILSDGSKLQADSYVFACGPWLSKIFPEALKNIIKPTRQEVFFFGTPYGDSSLFESNMGDPDEPPSVTPQFVCV